MIILNINLIKSVHSFQRKINCKTDTENDRVYSIIAYSGEHSITYFS